MIGSSPGPAAQLTTVDREPVALPALSASTVDGWHVLLDLDERPEPWALVGGQMTVLHCLENGIDGARVTTDNDLLLDVWTRRDAVRTTGRWLQRTHGFTSVATLDGFSYRYAKGDVHLDLLVPEGLSRQRRQPSTADGAPPLAIEGGNQALLRVERLPVLLGTRQGYLRRPDLLGALVIKAAAFVVDSRDPGRHAEDLALLGQVALDSGRLRALDAQARPHDRKRLRLALRSSHPSIRAGDPDRNQPPCASSSRA